MHDILKSVRVKVCCVPIFFVVFVLWHFLCPRIKKGKFIPDLLGPRLIVDVVRYYKCGYHLLLQSILSWVCIPQTCH
jgi:hypothetical protein